MFASMFNTFAIIPFLHHPCPAKSLHRVLLALPYVKSPPQALK